MFRMTFNKFRASRKDMFWHEVAKLLRIDEKYTDAPRAKVYMDQVYIEDYIFKSFVHSEQHKGRYVLVIAREVHYSDVLLELERKLYKYMMQNEAGF